MLQIIIRVKENKKQNIYIKCTKSTNANLYTLYDTNYAVDIAKLSSFNVYSFIEKIQYLKPSKKILKQLKEFEEMKI